MPVVEVSGEPVDRPQRDRHDRHDRRDRPQRDRPERARPQQDGEQRGGEESGRASSPRGARLLTLAAVLVLALGAAAVIVTLSNPDRLGLAFSGGGTGAGPTVTMAAEPDGAGAAGATEATEATEAAEATEGAEATEAAGATEGADEPTLTAPLAGRRRATFELVDGVARFDLRVEDLGEELYRISSPTGSAVDPRPEALGERVRLKLVKSDGSGPVAVEVVLNSRVSWRLRLVGGVSEQILDLTGARLSGVELIGGSARTELRLPRIVGTLTVRMTGGVSQLAVEVTGAPPVRVRAGAGAGSIAVYDDGRTGLRAGDAISSPDWERSADRLDVDLVGEANTVTVAGR